MESLIALDRALFFWINNGWSSRVLDFIAANLTHLAGQTAGFVFVLLVLALSRSGWPFLWAAVSYGVNAAVFKSVKYWLYRPRPLLLPGAILRQAPELSGATDPSFPSGHAAIAFMAATFLSARYPRWSPAFYVLAVMIGLTRIYLGLHYPSDVLAGALIGTVTAAVVLAVARRLGRTGGWVRWPGGRKVF